MQPIMKPAILNTDMVRAILDGRKLIYKNITAVANQTITQSATDDTPSFLFARKGEKILVNKILGQDHWSKGSFKYICQDIEKKYGGFYVKDEEISINTPYKVGDIIYVRETWGEVNGEIFYKEKLLRESSLRLKWKPSIHMPKEYARLFLRVKDVRIERLNDISEEDAIKEGAYDTFASLWESIYGDGTFDNRYVWGVEFERISKEEAMK